MSVGKAEVLAVYKAEVAKGKSPKEARQATRTEVHALLQLEQPFPKASDGDDADDLWAIQKTHGKKLWKITDKLVSEAGITDAGMVS